MQVDFSKINFDEKGLIPAIVQDAATNAVLTVSYTHLTLPTKLEV